MNGKENGDIGEQNTEEFIVCKAEELTENKYINFFQYFCCCIITYNFSTSFRLQLFKVNTKQNEEAEVLVVKENNDVYAMGTKCTHYGAPLINGIFCNGKVYCPWHGACFNSKTGMCSSKNIYFAFY